MTSRHKCPASGIVSAFIALALMVPLHAPRAAAQPPQQESNPASPKKSAPPLDDPLLSSALCSIVYQRGRVPGPAGLPPRFDGNVFFTTRHGALPPPARVRRHWPGGQPYLL